MHRCKNIIYIIFVLYIFSFPQDLGRTVPGLPTFTPGIGGASNIPPPLPARPSQQMMGSYGGMGYGSSYGSGYGSSYGNGLGKVMFTCILLSCCSSIK